MLSVLIVSVLMMRVLTRCSRIVSVLIISQLIVRAGMVSMLTIGGGAGPATGPNENGAPANKFFSRKLSRTAKFGFGAKRRQVRWR